MFFAGQVAFLIPLYAFLATKMPSPVAWHNYDRELGSAVQA